MSGYVGRNQLMTDDPSLFGTDNTRGMHPLLAQLLEAKQATQPPQDGIQYLSAATPLQDQIAPGMMPTTRELAAQPVSQFVNPQTGQLTEQGQARLDNPAMGFAPADLGAIGMTGFRSYHGSPHDFAPTPNNPLGEFRDSAIGSGEGNQAFGYGHYLADEEAVSRGYRDDLTPQNIPNPEFYALQREYNIADANSRDAMMKSDSEYNAAIAARDAVREKMRGVPADIPNPTGPQGHMYEVQVNADPAHFLDWDKPLSEQSQHVQQVFGEKGPLSEVGRYFTQNPRLPTSGMHIEDTMKMMGHTPEGVSVALRDAGIPGIRYLDAGSRGAGQGTQNSVIFDPKDMEIIRKYGLAGLMAGGMGAAGLIGQQGQQQ